MVIGVAMVVAVFVSVFGMADGFREGHGAGGASEPRASCWAAARTRSPAASLTRESVRLLADVHGIRRTEKGEPMLSAEALAPAPLMDRSSGLDAPVTVARCRFSGAGDASRNHVSSTAACSIAGSREVIVGRAVQQRMVGANVGNAIELPDGDWKITGVFESGGDARESEVLTDAETLMTAYRRESFNSALDDAG